MWTQIQGRYETLTYINAMFPLPDLIEQLHRMVTHAGVDEEGGVVHHSLARTKYLVGKEINSWCKFLSNLFTIIFLSCYFFLSVLCIAIHIFHHLGTIITWQISSRVDVNIFQPPHRWLLYSSRCRQSPALSGLQSSGNNPDIYLSSINQSIKPAKNLEAYLVSINWWINQ